MNIHISTGITFEKEIRVSENLTATAFGSGSLPVFATPAMIALLEATANESVQPLLPEGFTSVGTEIQIKHLKATVVGRKIKSESYLRFVNDRKLTFELHAWDEKGMIGIGTHSRVIVDKKEFMEKLK